MTLPRIGVGALGAPGKTPAALTGFSDTVDLSQHGLLGLDDTVVMRVETGYRLSSPHWKGLSFDYFDGIHWRRSSMLRRQTQMSWDGQRTYRWPERLSPSPQRRTMKIEVEPMGADVLFITGQTEAIEIAPEQVSRGPSDVDPGEWLEVDGSGDLHHIFDPSRPLHYELTMTGGLPDADRPLSPSMSYRYLLLPRNFTERATELAVKITEHADTNVEKAQAIESYLRSSYQYSLERPQRGRNPVDHFLFEDPRGHCVFFSTAMVLLLRAVEVPARNVNGFVGGEWNEYGGYYLIRKRDAHSWVEVYQAGEGWMTFEPTPDGGLPAARALVSREGGWIDSPLIDHAQRLWRQWVLGFSRQNQVGLLLQFGAKSRGGPGGDVMTSGDASLWRTLWSNAGGWIFLLAAQALLAWGLHKRGWSGLATALVWLVGLASLRWLWASPPGLLAIAIALFTPPILYWRLRLIERVRPAHESSPQTSLQVHYDRLLQELARRGDLTEEVLQRPPEALARALEQTPQPIYQRAAGYLRRYCALRFGPAATDVSAQRALKREWSELRRELRRG